MSEQSANVALCPKRATPLLTMQTRQNSLTVAKKPGNVSPRSGHSPIFFQNPQYCSRQCSSPMSITDPITTIITYTTQDGNLAAVSSPMQSPRYVQGTNPPPIIINPASVTPGCGGSFAPVGCITPAGCPTPVALASGRTTPVYAMQRRKRYVDLLLASTASTVAIDNKIEQAMDLVKSHLMLAVREEVDVLKERIVELMDRITHLEYENTVLKQYATPEALQQLQHHSPNP